MSEVLPQSYLEPLDFVGLFGRPARVEIDLGCGDGQFLVAQARQHPDTDFLGVERMPGRVETALRKIARLGLTNARVLQLETAYTVRFLVPAESVSRFHLLFPDPWPKRRHWRRRVMNDEFLRDLWAKLQPGGRLRVVTDDTAYYQAIESVVLNQPDLWQRETDAIEEFPVTTFESRFREQGLPIHRISLTKRSPVR